MQLQIPLLSPQTLKTSPQEETTTDNDEVPDQVLDEGDTQCLMSEQETTMNEVLSVEPSLFEDISADMMEELLTELRADPNLSSIMDDFETSFSDSSYELDIGMNIEIDDRLERELEVLM